MVLVSASNISLYNDGKGLFCHNHQFDGLRLSRDTSDTQGLGLASNSGGNSIFNRHTSGNPKNLNFYGLDTTTDTAQFYGKFENTTGEFNVGSTTSSKACGLHPAGYGKFLPADWANDQNKTALVLGSNAWTGETTGWGSYG